MQWDEDGLLKRVEIWPPGHRTQIEREFGVPGRSKGQIVKEFAMENNVDILDLDQHPQNS